MRNFIKNKTKPKSDKPTPKRDDWKRDRNMARKAKRMTQEKNYAA